MDVFVGRSLRNMSLENTSEICLKGMMTESIREHRDCQGISLLKYVFVTCIQQCGT